MNSFVCRKWHYISLNSKKRSHLELRFAYSQTTKSIQLKKKHRMLKLYLQCTNMFRPHFLQIFCLHFFLPFIFFLVYRSFAAFFKSSYILGGCSSFYYVHLHLLPFLSNLNLWPFTAVVLVIRYFPVIIFKFWNVFSVTRQVTDL